MNPWWTSDNGETQLQLACGHVLNVLHTMPSESVHCVITSPPYWGLRDYSLPPLVWGGDPACGHEWGDLVMPMASGVNDKRATLNATDRDVQMDERVISRSATCTACGAWRGSLGLEPTPDLYVQHMVCVFREVRRVLRRDGTLWLNLGDAYVSAPMGNTKSRDQYHNGGRFEYSSSEKRVASYADGRQQMDKTRIPGLKSKDLLGMPWRVAFALQQDGWYLRSDIIWAKPNPMPESVTDRPTKAHEYLFLLARSERYYYDAEAIREDAEYGRRSAFRSHNYEQGRSFGNQATVKGGSVDGSDPSAGRNCRTVWEIATQPYPDAHFATFPEALVEPCVLAGTSERGCCARCGAPWERETETALERFNDGGNSRPAEGKDLHNRQTRSSGLTAGGFIPGLTRTHITLDWSPTCTCDAATMPATVLDPFCGSGTALLVAQRLGRHAIGIDLSLAYCALARQRLEPAHAQQRLRIVPAPAVLNGHRDPEQLVLAGLLR
jgi:DNA modification methylase